MIVSGSAVLDCKSTGKPALQENPAPPDGQSTPATVANPCVTIQARLKII